MVVETISGTYLEISKVTVPSEAEVGAVVRAKIEITNLSNINIKSVSPRVESNDVPSWSGTAVTLYAGRSITWAYTFTMPNKSISFDVNARYWGTDYRWHTDDTERVSVSLTEAPSTEWVNVARTILSLDTFVSVTDWIEVTKTSLDVVAFVPVTDWIEVASTRLPVEVFTPVTNWVEVAKVTLTVKAPVVPTPPPPPPKEGIPDWVIIGGAAAGAAGVAYLATKKA